MPATVTSLLTFLGRWPRRLAALACLLLAGAAALGSHRPEPSATLSPAKDSALRPGERSVPVRITGVDGHSYLHVGDHVDLLAAPSSDLASDGAATSQTVAAAVVARGVRVLAVLPPSDVGAEGSTVLVAADLPTARKIASVSQRPVLVVSDNPP